MGRRGGARRGATALSGRLPIAGHRGPGRGGGPGGTRMRAARSRSRSRTSPSSQRHAGIRGCRAGAPRARPRRALGGGRRAGVPRGEHAQRRHDAASAAAARSDRLRARVVPLTRVRRARSTRSTRSTSRGAPSASWRCPGRTALERSTCLRLLLALAAPTAGANPRRRARIWTRSTRTPGALESRSCRSGLTCHRGRTWAGPSAGSRPTRPTSGSCRPSSASGCSRRSGARSMTH